MVQVLDLAKSSYLESFQKLANEIEHRTLEARDNHQMLKPLYDPCLRLNKSSLTEMPAILQDIMFLVRACWANSKYLNTVDAMTGLLRKVSNSLIGRCREVVDRTEIMQGSIPNSVKLLKQSIHCGDVWKNLFFTHIRLIAHSAKQRMEAAAAAAAEAKAVASQSAAEADSEAKQDSGAAEAAAAAAAAAEAAAAAAEFDVEGFLKEWDGERESRIFAQMDAFMQRCADLLEVCEWRLQFSYTLACDDASGAAASNPEPAEDEDEEDEDGKKKEKQLPQLPPAFGGSRAQEVYARLAKTRRSFCEQMKVLQCLSYDPLDVKAPGWHQDFSKLKVQVKDLEVELNSAIMSSFETATHTSAAFSLQEAFQHLAARETIKRVVDKKTADMIGLWADDINWVKKSLDKNRKHPPLHMDDAGSQYHLQFVAAPFSGAAAWAKMLLQRIQIPHELMLTSHHVVSTKEYQDVFEQFKTVEHALTDYIERQYQDWQELMETAFRGGEDIMGINLVRRNPQTQLLEVTFPPAVAVLFKEVEGWERVGYSIPFVAMEHSKDKERISIVRCHVRAMAREYNTILSALAPWERKIFADKLKALDRKIGPAVTRITWSNKGIVEFCRDVRKLCTGSQGLVDDFKSYTTNVARCCREMAHLPLVVIEHKKLYTAPEFVAVQAKHRDHVVETLQADIS